ncbi:MAG: lysine/arginine/ornithine ABC transporter substrate-binding protein [Hyphomicrobiales bacterium]
MKLNMKLVGLIALGVMAATSAGATEWTKTVRVATEGAYPPFNSFDSNKNLIGFDIDITAALCAKIKVDCPIVAQDWDGIIPGLLANKYDAIIASMSITPERKKKVAFTKKYYQSPPRFVAAAKMKMTDTSPAALKGKTIGVQSATTHANYIEKFYKDSKVKSYGTQDDANLDLAAGRLDIILADSLVLLEWMKTDDGKGFEFVGPKIDDKSVFGEGEGIAVRKEDAHLRDLLDQAILDIIADGTYAKINAKYFPFSIY